MDSEQYSIRKVTDVCENLLKDSFLYIRFEDNPFSITLEFVSNIEPKLVKLKCKNISKFKIEEESYENAYYTILEVSVSYVQGTWKLHLIPEIEVMLECKDLVLDVNDLSTDDLKNMGFT